MQSKLALALIAALAISTAQTSQQATFQAGTRLTLVPVVVRDRDGRPVTGLNQDSFQLFDNGKPQAITSFSVEQGAATAQSPDHFTAYFFDDLSLNDFSAVVPLRDAALRSFAELQPGDRAAILSSSCRIAQDFTDDRAKLDQALARLQTSPIPTCAVAKTLPLQVVLLQSLVRRMAVLPGTKNIVIVSAGFRVQMDKQAMRDQLIDEAVRAKVSIHALHVSGTNRPNRVSQGALAPRDEIPASSEIDPENLFIIADGTGGATIEATNSAVAAVFDHNGNFIEGKQLLLKLRLRDQSLANLERQPPETLKTAFDLSPGAYLVRLVVRSAEGQSMAAASRAIEIP
jgi:VWFA-related protein